MGSGYYSNLHRTSFWMDHFKCGGCSRKIYEIIPSPPVLTISLLPFVSSLQLFLPSTSPSIFFLIFSFPPLSSPLKWSSCCSSVSSYSSTDHMFPSPLSLSLHQMIRVLIPLGFYPLCDLDLRGRLRKNEYPFECR